MIHWATPLDLMLYLFLSLTKRMTLFQDIFHHMFHPCSEPCQSTMPHITRTNIGPGLGNLKTALFAVLRAVELFWFSVNVPFGIEG